MQNIKSLIFMSAIAGMIALPTLAVRAQEQLPDTREQNEIHFITGGIGVEETQAMEAVKSDYNLRITSADATGHFSGEPHIVIRDMQQNELLSAEAGPLFYAEMPSGRYIIEGSNYEQEKSQKVLITGKKPVSVRFTWKAHPDDTGTSN